jgi:putative flippase GtrA
LTLQVLERREDASRIVRFLATGVLNTAFGYAVYAVLLWMGLPYAAALLLATIVGVVFNFFSYGKLVFQGETGKRTFVRFVIAYLAIYALNVGLLHLGTQGLGWNAYVAQAACMVPIVVVSWMLMNRWVFGRQEDSWKQR